MMRFTYVVVWTAFVLVAAESFRVPSGLLKATGHTSRVCPVDHTAQRRSTFSAFESISNIRGGGTKHAIDIKSETEFRAIVKSSKKGQLIVVDFTASWCGPCKSIAPRYQEMASSAEYSSVVFLKVDVDDLRDIAEEYRVSSMPTFLFLKDGKEVKRFSGASMDKLKQIVQALR